MSRKAVLAAVLLAAGCGAEKERKPIPMDSINAYRYSLAWARTARAGVDDLKTGAGGDFHGTLGPLHFEYQAKDGALVVRAAAGPFLSELGDHPDILTELDRIAREEPGSVCGGRFELKRLEWRGDMIREASLYIRLDFTDAGLSEQEFLARCRDLRDAALVWNRSRLDEVIRWAIRKGRKD